MAEEILWSVVSFFWVCGECVFVFLALLVARVRIWTRCLVWHENDVIPCHSSLVIVFRLSFLFFLNWKRVRLMELSFCRCIFCEWEFFWSRINFILLLLSWANICVRESLQCFNSGPHPSLGLVLSKFSFSNCGLDFRKCRGFESAIVWLLWAIDSSVLTTINRQGYAYFFESIWNFGRNYFFPASLGIISIAACSTLFIIDASVHSHSCPCPATFSCLFQAYRFFSFPFFHSLTEDRRITMLPSGVLTQCALTHVQEICYGRTIALFWKHIWNQFRGWKVVHFTLCATAAPRGGLVQVQWNSV